MKVLPHIPCNERIYRAVHVYKYRLREVADFVRLDCSTISVIANLTPMLLASHSFGIRMDVRRGTIIRPREVG